MPDSFLGVPIGQFVFIAVMGVSGVFWTATYVLMIHAGRRDGVCGMPLAALCANLAWETTYVFIDPHPWYQLPANIVWLILDCVIAWQAVRYYRAMYPALTLARFVGMFSVGLLTAGFAIHFVSIEMDDGSGVYAAFGQNLMMSILFVGWLATRPGLPGQRLSIAWTKLLGTAAASLAFAVLPALDPDKLFRQGDTTAILFFLFAATLVFDVMYLVGVLRRRRDAVATTSQVVGPAP